MKKKRLHLIVRMVREKEPGAIVFARRAGEKCVTGVSRGGFDRFPAALRVRSHIFPNHREWESIPRRERRDKSRFFPAFRPQAVIDMAHHEIPAPVREEQMQQQHGITPARDADHPTLRERGFRERGKKAALKPRFHSTLRWPLRSALSASSVERTWASSFCWVYGFGIKPRNPRESMFRRGSCSANPLLNTTGTFGLIV